MNNSDGKKDMFGPHDKNINWDQLASLVLVAGLVGGFVLSIVFHAMPILAIGVFIGLAGLATFKSLATERGLRYVWFALILPAAIGISLAIYPFANVAPALLGIAASITTGLWLFVWRYPAQYRAASKAFQFGNYMQALNLANQALNIRPTLWEAYQFRSVTYLKLSNLVDAERDAPKALQLKPDSYFNLTALGNVLMANQKFAEASDLFSKALLLTPQVGLNYFNKGVCCYRLDDFSEAVQYLQVAVDKGLTGDGLLLGNYYLAQSLSKIRDVNRAAQYYDAMKKYRATYEKLLKEATDAPDYLGTVTMRDDLENMRRYME